MYAFVKYAMSLKHEGVVLRVNEKQLALLWPLQLCQGLPILVDSFIIAFSTYDFNARTNMLLITALIFINGKVSPFYHANHLIFHGLLLIQTIFLCNSNVIANRGFEL
jgi:cation transport ATPase